MSRCSCTSPHGQRWKCHHIETSGCGKDIKNRAQKAEHSPSSDITLALVAQSSFKDSPEIWGQRRWGLDRCTSLSNFFSQLASHFSHHQFRSELSNPDQSAFSTRYQGAIHPFIQPMLFLTLALSSQRTPHREFSYASWCVEHAILSCFWPWILKDSRTLYQIAPFSDHVYFSLAQFPYLTSPSHLIEFWWESTLSPRGNSHQPNG